MCQNKVDQIKTRNWSSRLATTCFFWILNETCSSLEPTHKQRKPENKQPLTHSITLVALPSLPAAKPMLPLLIWYDVIMMYSMGELHVEEPCLCVLPGIL